MRKEHRNGEGGLNSRPSLPADSVTADSTNHNLTRSRWNPWVRVGLAGHSRSPPRPPHPPLRAARALGGPEARCPPGRERHTSAGQTGRRVWQPGMESFRLRAFRVSASGDPLRRLRILPGKDDRTRPLFGCRLRSGPAWPIRRAGRTAIPRGTSAPAAQKGEEEVPS